VHSYRNGLKTAVLIASLSALILVAGALIGGTRGLVIAFVIALATNGYAYFNSAKLALRSMKAYPVDSHQQPVMFKVVQELSTAAGQPMPKLYVSPTDAPNAFATGRNPDNAAVCCTEGILSLLDERELRGVLGHELSHVYNRDILISSVAAALATVILFLAQLAYFLPFLGGGSRDDRDGGNTLAVLLIAILGPVAAGLIQLAISRSREYQADQSGAMLTHDPLALASALAKLDAGTARRPLKPTPDVQTTSALMIANPFNAKGMSQLFSTHPPIPERIARLQELARQLQG
jgi:heat shock protein HtpX